MKAHPTLFRPARFAAFLFVLVLLTPGLAGAGQTCDEHPLTIATLEKSLALAQRTWQQLDATEANVVLLARVGHDLSEYGLRYSHVGWVYKREGKWVVVHELNQCGSAVSSLYEQGLGDFFLDDMYRYEAAYAVPTPEVQAQLLALFAQKDRVTRMHARAYNMLAYPWATRYQQSNQWALETLAMALDRQIDSRESAQRWLRLKGYRPSTLEIGPLKRLGAEVSRANISFNDQPIGSRFANHIETVTADSVFVWLQRSALSGPLRTVD
jgi:hypothetical protein